MLAEQAAHAAGLDPRECTSADPRLVCERVLFVELSNGPLGLDSIVRRGS